MIWRRIGSDVLGLIVAWLCLSAAEFGTHHLYPPPAGTIEGCASHDFAIRGDARRIANIVSARGMTDFKELA
jgi:hypothetical protein